MRGKKMKYLGPPEFEWGYQYRIKGLLIYSRAWIIQFLYDFRTSTIICKNWFYRRTFFIYIYIRALVFTDQQAIKGLKMTGVKQFSGETNGLIYIINKKRETLINFINKR